MMPTRLTVALFCAILLLLFISSCACHDRPELKDDSAPSNNPMNYRQQQQVLPAFIPGQAKWPSDHSAAHEIAQTVKHIK